MALLTPLILDNCVKGVLSRKINDSKYTLVPIGKGANSYHPDRGLIGERNWQWWEIMQAHKAGHKFIAVRLRPMNKTPDPLYGKGARWANYTVNSILNAINAA